MSLPLAFVVDDNDDIARLFSDILEREGYRIEVAHDGAVAAEMLSEIVPSLVILDLMLPYKSGEEILDQIRADQRLENTRVVIASADKLRAQDLASQVDAVLIKPFRLAQIRKAIM